MTERGPRIPMPNHHSFIGDGEVHTRVEGMVGHRVTMDIALGVFDRMGREAITFAVKKLAEDVVWREQGPISRAVSSYLDDRTWAEPIIRAAIQSAVKQIIRDMMLPPDEAGERP